MASYGDEAMKLIRELKRQPDLIQPYRDDTVRDVLSEMKYLVDDMQEMYKEIQTLSSHEVIANSMLSPEEITERKNGLTIAMSMHSASLLRNKRCLLAYHHHRLDRIRSITWELGGGAAAATIGDEGAMDHDDVVVGDNANSASATANGNNIGGMATSSSNGMGMGMSGVENVGGLPYEVRRNLSPAEHEFLSTYRSLIEDMKGSYLDIDLGAALVPPKDLFVEVRVLKDLGEIVTDSGNE
ncbi:DNA replication protein psf1 [Blyttiomyces sp. JEL0837]|nr:DNA replication protein psf1 [Blyttiomyces sp. JEL0837]